MHVCLQEDRGQTRTRAEQVWLLPVKVMCADNRVTTSAAAINSLRKGRCGCRGTRTARSGIESQRELRAWLTPDRAQELSPGLGPAANCMLSLVCVGTNSCQRNLAKEHIAYAVVCWQGCIAACAVEHQRHNTRKDKATAALAARADTDAMDATDARLYPGGRSVACAGEERHARFARCRTRPTTSALQRRLHHACSSTATRRARTTHGESGAKDSYAD